MNDIRTASQQDLNEFANLVADQIRGGVIPLGMALGALHVAALELNRRHGSASLQNDLSGAIATLDDFGQYCDQSDHIAQQAILCAVRAAGCVLDLATAEKWAMLEWAGYTREGLTYFLQCYAGAEHQARGHKVTAPRVAVLVPDDADDMVAPF